MHILLIEDDVELGTELQKALACLGATSEWVRSARQARHFVNDNLATQRFACAVLDIGLPDGSGLDALKEWRNAGNAIPVILLTARDALDMRIAGLDAGADDYVIKPVAPSELLSRIRAVTRRAAGKSSSIWTVGNLRIDCSLHQVHLGPTEIILSPKEFQILHELARHSGKVVTRHRLSAAVAPLGEPMESGTLEWHIHNLRKKLGEQAIRTVRGVGYALLE